MGKLTYDFGEYTDLITTYIDIVIEKSMVNFKNQVKLGQITDIMHDSEALAGSIQNLEEYLYYNYQKSPENFNHILTAVVNNVKTVSVLPIQKRGIYGEAQTKTKTVFVNPDLKDSQNLTGEERKRLYMAHELGHMVNDAWMKSVIEYANKQIGEGRLTKEHAQLIYDGFSMLDEATTQNRAEEFAYQFAGKQRPKLQNYRSQRLYKSDPYKANFDYYGELQEPATMFARTLRGIGKVNDDVQALNMLSQRAISPNFFKDVLYEYTTDGQMPSFIKETQYMGLIKRASYANFGYEDASYLQNSKSYLDNLRAITSKMKDGRDPLGIPVTGEGNDR